MKSFVNFSNHPSSQWTREQLDASESYGTVVDFPFPAVSPDADEKEISDLAQQCLQQILSLNPAAVMCQGEFTLCFQVVNLLKDNNIPVLAACSERKTIEKNGFRLSEFRFVRYRYY